MRITNRSAEWLLTVAGLLSLVAHVQAQAPQLPEAAVLWARAIQAKGGDEALSRIRSLLLTEHDRNGRLRRATLVVPDLGVWDWGPERPSGKGPPTAQATNLENNTTCRVIEGMAPLTFPRQTQMSESRGLHLGLVYLLRADTPPNFTGVSRVQVGKRAVYRIGVMVHRLQATVFLDEESTLPIRVDLDGSPTPRRDLYDYTVVDGVRVPQRIVAHPFAGKPFTIQRRVRLNVEYAPSIFTCPAESLHLPDSWQK